MSGWEWALGIFAVLAIVVDAWRRPPPSDMDRMEARERQEALKIRQKRLSEALKRRGAHLLAGKRYRPVLTKAEPVTQKPRLSAVRGGRP